MKSKVLVIAVALMAVAMRAAPMVGMVQAGKGQEKLDFLLHMEGTTNPPPEKVWPAGVTAHVRGGNWIVLGDFYLQIGAETIPKDCLSYLGKLDINVDNKQGFYVLTVREVITIYEDATTSVVRGTIEMLAISDNPAGNGANFVGFGTGEFEGVKVSGTTTSSTMVNPIPPPDELLVLDRMGTTMGWPT